jgi:tellurite resistance protein
MYEVDAFRRRGQALEDEFFHRVDEELRAKLRETIKRDESKKRLAAATGFNDDSLLNHLVDEKFEASTIAALALIPIVWVAWADGKITPQERQSVIHASLRRGLDHEPFALHLVEVWISKRPPQSLWDLWKEYMTAMKESRASSTVTLLAPVILEQATEVAKASGSRLGKHKINQPEQAILDEIAALLA